MSTDLTAVKDHPATLLRERYAERQAALGNPQGVAGLIVAGNALNAYEQVNHVTFAALDNDALAAVREAYEANLAVRDAGPEPDGLVKMLGAHEDLRDAVRDLLGLADD